MKKLYEINKEFKGYGIVDSYYANGIKESVAKIREFIESKKQEILLAWWAEYGFDPGKAVLVEERSGDIKTYIRECTAEEGERAQTAANTARRVPEDSTQISAFVEWVASLSKTEYAAHQQLVAVIDKAQKLLPC